MKMSLMILAFGLAAGGTTGLMELPEQPTDQGTITRERADQIMGQTYGQNWSTLFTNRKTTDAQKKAMVGAYESLIGYHRAK